MYRIAWILLWLIFVKIPNPLASWKGLSSVQIDFIQCFTEVELRHIEYVGLAKSLGMTALETVTFSMTSFTWVHFTNSCMEKIYSSYKALNTEFIESTEDAAWGYEDDSEETKYQVRGQDHAVDLYGALDVMKPDILLMIKSQARTLPPWKIVACIISVFLKRLKGSYSNRLDVTYTINTLSCIRWYLHERGIFLGIASLPVFSDERNRAVQDLLSAKLLIALHLKLHGAPFT